MHAHSKSGAKQERETANNQNQGKSGFTNDPMEILMRMLNSPPMPMKSIRKARRKAGRGGQPKPENQS